LVDAAQSAGSRRIDVQEMCIDLLAFPGHKGLLGPQGTGGLYVNQQLPLQTIVQGGTGSQSERLSQPEGLPEKFESGTLNTPGLAGLAAGVRLVLEQGEAFVAQAEAALANRLLDGIAQMKGIRVLGPVGGPARAGVVSVCFDQIDPARAALLLDSAFHIAARAGLHCAADAHRAIGTLERGGALRLSPNQRNTPEEIDQCLAALEFCARGGVL
jgi:selenocysteine lyase/cysteine desulfurase